ncbi:UvrD-helicase domain-containing protein [Nocardia alba]|uniref:AAA domain-containing protein n=1 Tax=Nocardia alba TaxID=225051 RepID=A0A4R1FRZ6_9NOCA|nr:UvrD-helicase domain-containing protein [Nocardia alba]TCJ96314.1 AAA domain-containing protein [Nocardia alba]
MDSDLRTKAAHILDAMPCALEMPAGTGKTQLVAGVTALATELGHRTLILTHTNAGVSALRKRLKKFGIAPGAFHIDTITGWAFELVRHYPKLAGLRVPSSPDWEDSQSYLNAAIAVSQSSAIKRMHAASFRYFLVDEYQDCSVRQHEFMLSIADSIENTAIFGDRLQGIFGFKGEQLVSWADDVFPRFPLCAQEHAPWRWRGHNDELGNWLLGIRSQLVPGGTLDLSATRISGLSWQRTDFNEAVRTAYRFRNPDESVVVIDKWRQGSARFAGRLGGSYSVMEDLNGRFMQDELKKLDAMASDKWPIWLVQLAKACFSGLADINATVVNRLETGKSIDGLKRPALTKVMAAIRSVQSDSTLARLASAMESIESCGEAKLYSHESWRDITAAIRATSADDSRPLCDSLSIIRDRRRYSGRDTHRRVASRTLLIKGLEYDHAIITNADSINDARNLYVALTRPRKTLTIFSSSPTIRVA